MTHELGHVVGLRDGEEGKPLGGSNNGSIMNYDNNFATHRIPTSYDVTSVRMLYN